MDINKMKDLSYKELRVLFRSFLNNQSLSKLTINTACSDAFYLWRKGNKDQFWGLVTSIEFEADAKSALTKALVEHSTGNVNSLVSDYMNHLRRFSKFIESNGTAVSSTPIQKENVYSNPKLYIKEEVCIPSPSSNHIEFYLLKWDGLENYYLQENALNKLFFEMCPENKNISDVLLKSSTLNDFYSTNIFSIYPVAKHILALDIDSRLESCDDTLVRDIQYVAIGNKLKNFYSFATKYCSHHKPLDYPIYDSYVDRVLRYFRNRDSFSDFQSEDLKNYVKFKSILIDFRAFYGLGQYNLKQIDQYIWLLGKDYFPMNYGKKA